MSDLASFFSTSNLVLDRTDNYCMWLSNHILQCTSLWQQHGSVANCSQIWTQNLDMKCWNFVEIGFILYWFVSLPKKIPLNTRVTFERSYSNTLKSWQHWTVFHLRIAPISIWWGDMGETSPLRDRFRKKI